MSRPALAIALTLQLVAACGGEADPVRQVVLQVDLSACKPGCTISRYEIWVHRSLDSGARCAVHGRSVSGVADEVFAAPAEPLGRDFLAGAAAWCSETTEAPSPCCAALGACLPAPDKSDPDCQKAAATCPAEGDPFASTAGEYLAKNCGTKGAGSECLVCLGERELSLAGDEQLSVEMTAVAACKGAVPKATPCP